jgi:hypothetical protein
VDDSRSSWQSQADLRRNRRQAQGIPATLPLKQPKTKVGTRTTSASSATHADEVAANTQAAMKRIMDAQQALRKVRLSSLTWRLIR